MLMVRRCILYTQDQHRFADVLCQGLAIRITGRGCLEQGAPPNPGDRRPLQTDRGGAP